MGDDIRTGTTVDGHAVEVIGWRNYFTARVIIDGIEQTVLRSGRYRDGGSTEFVCEGGTLFWPNRLGSDDRTPRWTPGGDTNAQ